MTSRAVLAAVGSAVILLTGACADPAMERVSLNTPTVFTTPALPTVGTTSSAPTTSAAPPATSLDAPMATGPARPVTGAPRFFIVARTPIAHFADRSKTATFTPVRPAVHDAETGELVAEVPLPPGVRSSWHLVAAAPDNRTFALTGWTGPDSPIRFFTLTLDENGRPGEPVPVPRPEQDDPDQAETMALSADATRLAYATRLIRGGARISVLDLATGRRRDWSTREQSLITGLAWAPDGRTLAWVAGGKAIGLLDLARRDTDLMAATQFAAQGKWLLQSVAYTPDGGALVYSTGQTIERLTLDGQGETRVLARPELPRSASLGLRFSIDGTGRHLMFTHEWQRFVVDLTDGSTTSAPITAKGRAGNPPSATW
ncbi:hypothetical protein ACFOY2_14130 [Nonomuraea purpurea]|uniref:Lipoprotein LpqB beta-propeller domain-containing protein n=1 Tax=Nonomuraea purpurea TaxID=1849276 RepID=A0ABV8G5I6_9ACTN